MNLLLRLKEIPLPTVYDVPTDLFLERLASELKETVDQLRPPPWVGRAKTSAHAEMPPVSEDWWYTRAASVMRKLYVHGPSGVSHLAAAYGGRLSRGPASERAWAGGRSSIRKILQQLEAVGLVEKQGKEGRSLTAKGRAMMDQVASSIAKAGTKARQL
ncbi:MAG: 30S ribosomal protein S19e [Candidatus Bathyarchaeia archaeon]